jgi:hypothetical protein
MIFMITATCTWMDSKSNEDIKRTASRTLQCAGQVERMGNMGNVYTVLIGKPEGKWILENRVGGCGLN